MEHLHPSVLNRLNPIIKELNKDPINVYFNDEYGILVDDEEDISQSMFGTDDYRKFVSYIFVSFIMDNAQQYNDRPNLGRFTEMYDYPFTGSEMMGLESHIVDIVSKMNDQDMDELVLEIMKHRQTFPFGGVEIVDEDQE